MRFSRHRPRPRSRRRRSCSDAELLYKRLLATIIRTLGLEHPQSAFHEPSLGPHLRNTALSPAVPVYVELDFDRGPKPKKVGPSGVVRKAAMLSGTFKLSFDENENQYDLYDLENDPDETRDVSTDHPEVYERLQQALQVKMKDIRSDSLKAHNRVLTDDEKSMLEELGYLEQ